MTKIALVIGSLSKQSINRAVAGYIAAQAPAGVAIEEVQIRDLPLYTQDLDAESVPQYERVRAQLKAADAVLIVSPEHNRAMPAAVKNLIDIASRPYGQNV
uniref:NADPH-dependent FMN reductase n=1 Tax=Neisseria sp. TaxID=192066 RepID=UPI00359FDBD7